MPDEKVLANDESELVEFFLDQWQLLPVEEDPHRKPVSQAEQAFRTVPGSYGEGDHEVEVQFARVELPLVPRKSNGIALRLRSSNWPMSLSGEAEASFRDRDHILILRMYQSDVASQLDLARRQLMALSEDIKRHKVYLEEQVAQLVRARRAEVERRGDAFDQQMKGLGIEVKRRADATPPVNVRVRQEVRLLRDHPRKGSREPRLSPEQIGQIVDLIDQSGRGFETTPEVYGKLPEEQLRDVILGHLNAVFTIGAAAGETFSKTGKTDILLNVPGGAVLIVECKVWEGEKRYGEAVDQLFRYLTWRHTVAVIATFSRNRGLSAVIRKAEDATKSHSSFRGKYIRRGEAHAISVHEHPADADKAVEIHHLFFDLYVPPPGA